jgi:hypothetical protein
MRTVYAAALPLAQLPQHARSSCHTSQCMSTLLAAREAFAVTQRLSRLQRRELWPARAPG